MPKEHYKDSTKFCMTPAGMQITNLEKVAWDGLRAGKITLEEYELIKATKLTTSMPILDEWLHIMVKLGVVEIVD